MSVFWIRMPSYSEATTKRLKPCYPILSARILTKKRLTLPPVLHILSTMNLDSDMIFSVRNSTDSNYSSHEILQTSTLNSRILINFTWCKFNFGLPILFNQPYFLFSFSLPFPVLECQRSSIKLFYLNIYGAFPP